jgi:hypothetical protein
MQEVVLETDCSAIAEMLATQGGLKSTFRFILNEANEAGRLLPEWKVVHKGRECNGVAHELAHLAKQTKYSTVWRFAALMCVEQIIAQECIELSE